MKNTFLLWLGFFWVCIHLYNQHTYVFLGSYTRDTSSESLFVYELDTLHGTLTRVTAVKGISNPSYLTLSPDGKYVYACTESKTKNAGSVSSFSFDPENKKLEFLNRQPSGGENPVYVTVHSSGKWLINGNYTEGSVSLYPLAKDGSIEPMLQHIRYTEGSNVDSLRQNLSHIHAAVFSPKEDHLFLTDLGADQIRCYTFDSTKQEPLLLATTPFIKTAPGSGPRHFIFHPKGTFAYCIEELSGTISAYTYTDGSLTFLQSIPTHSKKIRQGFESSDLHISPDGKFLYASNRGDENNLAIFSIAPDGKLSTIGYQSTFGIHPRIFAIDETGNFMIVTHVVSGNVTVFKRNTATGKLKKLNTDLKIHNVSCVKIKRY